jgi:REP element-mobilizing transposase RayT
MLPVSRRKTIRLPVFDYAQPALYFVTVCAADRACLFGSIADGSMVPSAAGQIVAEIWHDLPLRFREVSLDAFVLMPNHVHGVIQICEPMQRGLAEVVGAFKSIAARRINEFRRVAAQPVWQRGFYEHVVRNEAELGRIRAYIDDNPAKWPQDEENPGRKR